MKRPAISNQPEVKSLRLKSIIAAAALIALMVGALTRGGVARAQVLPLSARLAPNGLAAASPVKAEDDAARNASVVEAYGKLPISFEPNIGQFGGRLGGADQLNFLSRGNGYTLFLNPRESILRLHLGSRSQELKAGPQAAMHAESGEHSAAELVSMKLIGAAARPRAIGLDELPGKVNYLRGNDPRKWHTDIPTYAKVKLEQVYPGIDLVYYGNQRQLEYDFVVQPGADPRAIRMDVRGIRTGNSARSVAPRIDRNGDLILADEGNELRFRKPVVYQPANASTRKPVAGQFKLDKGLVSFQVASYDRSKPLVIDPVLAYSTFLGGSAGSNEETFGSIAVDSAGDAYVAGETDSTDFPAVNPFQSTHATGDDSDGYVAKLNPAGSALIYSTYLGGTGEDFVTGIAVDPMGRAVVVGNTCSTDFPVTKGAFQSVLKTAGCGTLFPTGYNLFVSRLSASGSALLASTYLGGSTGDASEQVARDNLGNVYVTGFTISADYPVTAGVIQSTFHGSGPLGEGDGVVTKLTSNLSALVYSTYLGGSGDDVLIGIAVDSAGDAFVAGASNSVDFPVTAGAFQTTFGGAGALNFGDAVVAKLNPTATALTYSTYLGGSDGDTGTAVAIDPAGDAFVTGDTLSSNFPVTPTAYQIVYGGTGPNNFGDVFVSKLNPAGSALVYSTYIGGDGDESAAAIVVDKTGSAWVAGSTASDDFPTTSNAIQRIYGGPPASSAFFGDAFVLRLMPNGSALAFSTFLGGSGDDGSGGLAVKGGNAYIIGSSGSTNFPITAGAFQTSCGTACALDGFVAKIKFP